MRDDKTKALCDALNDAVEHGADPYALDDALLAYLDVAIPDWFVCPRCEWFKPNSCLGYDDVDSPCTDCIASLADAEYDRYKDDMLTDALEGMADAFTKGVKE